MTRIHSAVLFAAIIVSFALTPGASADDPGVDIPMPDPMQRRIIRLAAHDGAVTLAVSGRMGHYRSIEDALQAPLLDSGLHGRAFRAACAALPPEERYNIPECVVIEDFDAFIDADMGPRSLLYKPGVWRQYSLGQIERRHKTAQQFPDQQSPYKLPDYTDVILRNKFVWDDSVYIMYAIEAKGSDRPVSMGLADLRYDHHSNRYWMLRYNMISFEIPHLARTIIDTNWSSQNKNEAIKALDAAPEGSMALRITLDPASQPLIDGKGPRKFVIEKVDASDPEAIAENDLILYIREDPLPADPPLFLQVDPATLGKAGRALQKQLALLLVSDEMPIEEVLPIWHPSSRKNIRTNYNNYTHMKEYPKIFTPGDVGFSYPERTIPTMRLVTRIFTDEGVVWLGWSPWAPRMGKQRNDHGIQIVTVFQVLSDGEYKLGSRTTKQAPWHSQAAQFLNNYPDLASFIVRSHLSDKK